MRNSFLTIAFVLLTLITRAQTNTVTGVVKDEQGKPLHYVFVADMPNKKAVFTDSLGNFSIQAKPDAKLLFSVLGHKEESVTAGSGNLQVVLKSSGGESASSSSGSLQTTTYSNEMQPTIGSGGIIAPSHQKGNLRGSRYIPEALAHGYIITAAGELNYKPSYFFDYDKVDGSLLLTQDKQVITVVSWDQIQSFVLYDDKDVRLTFAKAPDIDKSHYVQVLSSGSKYNVYKLIKTKFVKSDYVNNGVTSHGNDYDEYVDDVDYYIVKLPAGQPQKISLKKKAIKTAFATDADKVNKFLSDNSGDIDEAYLSKLGDYMNQ